MSIGEVEPLWSRCERAWSEWLQAKGHVVVPLHKAVGNTPASEAPLIEHQGRKFRAPDFLSNRDGEHHYWEVKCRSRPHVDGATAVAEHRVDHAAFEDYEALERNLATPVHLVVYEPATATSPHAWRTIRVRDARRLGRRARCPGNGGAAVDSWLWPVDAMDLVKAPPVEVSGSEQHFLSDDEPLPPRSPSEFEDLERSLRTASSAAAVEAPAVASMRDDPLACGVAGDPMARLTVLQHRLGIPCRPRYSVLLVGGKGVDRGDLLGLLHYGIRVFLVTEEEPGLPGGDLDLEAFKGARLLELGRAPGVGKCCEWVVDGVMPEDPARSAAVRLALEHADRAGGINHAQFMIVHAPTDRDVLVTAGAGTGKTETMTERLMFLMSTGTEPDGAGRTGLQLGDVTLVTFTRDAAREMRDRLARTLLLRQRLARSPVHPIRTWMLQLGSLQVSTIHALAKSILQQHGHAIGLSPGFRVSAQTMLLRRRLGESLAMLLEPRYRAIEHEVPFHEWLEHAEAVWKAIENNGVPVGAGEEFSWGHGGHADLVKQAVLIAAAQLQADSVRDRSIRTGQLVPKARDALAKVDATRPIRHLFVDEFQDTDAAQLEMILDLSERLGARLFVVGDAKQGIYRFRGASGDALSAVRARAMARGMKEFLEFGLTRNFRTQARLLDSMHRFFDQWGRRGLLAYSARERLIPAVGGGDQTVRLRTLPRKERSDFAGEAVKVVKQWRNQAPGDGIAILCRRNAHAIQVQAALRREGIPCALRVGGRFFRCTAVREARALLESVAAPMDDAALLELCETCWATGLLGKARPEGARPAEAWNEELLPPRPWRDRLADLASSGSFDRGDLEAIRARVRSLASMADRMSLPAMLSEWSRVLRPEASVEGDSSERERYRRCLDHLIGLVEEEFGGSASTAASVLEWLRLQVATNRNEDEPLGDPVDESVVALTVHKAKGLEFDRVLVPNTWTDFGAPPGTKTEATVLLGAGDRCTLAWSWLPPRGEEITNRQHGDVVRMERAEVEREEARLMYVAMTRAKRELLVFVPEAGGRGGGATGRWCDLLRLGSDEA